MPIFRQGKSYIWLFFVFAVLFVGVGMIGGNLRAAALSLPIVIGGILVCELQSGIALNSWWRANYQKGTWQYTALVIWHAFGTLALSAMAWFFWTSID